jgi:hypothetical protein
LNGKEFRGLHVELFGTVFSMPMSSASKTFHLLLKKTEQEGIRSPDLLDNSWVREFF